MKIVRLAIIFTILFLLSPVLLLSGIKNYPGVNQPSLNTTQKIYGNVTLSQSFLSRENNLSAIGMSIKNPNLNNKEQIKLALSGDDIYLESIKNGANITDGGFVKFDFPPVRDSADKIYNFAVSSPSSNKEEALEVFLTDNPPPGSKEFKVTGNLFKEAVAFVPYYKTTFINIANLVGTDLLKRILSDLVFFSLYIILVFSLLVKILKR